MLLTHWKLFIERVCPIVSDLNTCTDCLKAQRQPRWKQEGCPALLVILAGAGVWPQPRCVAKDSSPGPGLEGFTVRMEKHVEFFLLPCVIFYLFIYCSKLVEKCFIELR